MSSLIIFKKEEQQMFFSSGMMDYKNSMVKKMTNDDKIDPGTFSLMEPGWWALHATAIAGVYLLGSKLRNRY